MSRKVLDSYEILKRSLGDREAKLFMGYLDESNDDKIEKQLDLKLADFARKKDIHALDGKLDNFNVRLSGIESEMIRMEARLEIKLQKAKQKH